MNRELTRTPEATGESTPRWSVGGLLIEALARQDFAALADCLDPAVRLRALVPRGPINMTGCDEVAGWFRSLFGGPDDLELADGTVGEVGPRLYVRWRVSLTPSGTSGPRRLAEQHVFAATGADGRISALDLLCSGFVTQADHGC